MSQPEHDPRVIEAAGRLIDSMLADHEAQIAAMPHVALIFDPDDNTYQALGPFADGPTAMLAAQQQANAINAGFEPGDTPVTAHVAVFHNIDQKD